MMKTTVALLLAVVLATSSAISQDQTKEKKSGEAFTLREIKSFHDVLHPLVHDALPQGDFGRIRNGLDKLLQKAEAIQKARLPKRLRGRKQEFTNACGRLVGQLTDMVTMKGKVDDATIEKAFNEMHDTFEELVEIAK